MGCNSGATPGQVAEERRPAGVEAALRTRHPSRARAGALVLVVSLATRWLVTAKIPGVVPQPDLNLDLPGELVRPRPARMPHPLDAGRDHRLERIEEQIDPSKGGARADRFRYVRIFPSSSVAPVQGLDAGEVEYEIDPRAVGC